MKVLSPISSADETQALLEAGAEEFYAGVLSQTWRKKYTNVGSINRREWSVSNLNSYEELDQLTRDAHKGGAKVYVAMNALYTKPQYPALRDNLEQIFKIPVDALIIADVGMMLLVREMGWDREIHISTGGTTFNHRTARFFHEKFGAHRIVFPRHHNVEEIVTLSKSIDFMDCECFIFNSGCKNIDGFCTYHHGVNEILHKNAYTLPKKLGLDYVFLKTLRSLPTKMASKITRACNLKSDSACLLNWKVKPEVLEDWNEEQAKNARDWLESTFNLWSGLDPCGVCDLPDLIEGGIMSIKIVGRENPTGKKVNDVTYLRKMVDLWKKGEISRSEYFEEAKKSYKEVYGTSCREWCYYPPTESRPRPLEAKTE